jgi:hypothetical protein
MSSISVGVSVSVAVGIGVNVDVGADVVTSVVSVSAPPEHTIVNSNVTVSKVI